jgi:hypothetical protein
MIKNKVGVLMQVPLLAIFALHGCNQNSSDVSLKYEVESEKKIAVDSRLAIKIEGGAVFALLRFKNISGKKGLVHKSILLSDGEFGAFEVTRDGKEIPYKGPFIDKAWSVKEDWHPLEAGETYETTIRMTDYYDFSNPGKYRVLYERGYSPGGKFTLLQSNVVTLEVTK